MSLPMGREALELDQRHKSISAEAEPSGPRMLVVSLRAPARDRVRAGRVCADARGGLSAALAPIGNGIDTRDLSVDDLDEAQSIAQVSVFDQIANRALWPILHGMPTRASLAGFDFLAWRSATEALARRVCALYERRPIWVHDYQLALLPSLLRSAVQDAKVGWFCHVPWPGPDTLAVLPHRRELLDGLLGADTLAFHTEHYRDNFLACVRDLTPYAVRFHDAIVDVASREVRVVVEPVGVPFDSFDAGGRDIETRRAALRVRADVRTPLVIAAVDRLDYTKGIVERLLAFRRLLEADASLLGQASLIQVGVPTRDTIPGYAELRQTIESIVGAVNGRFGRPGWVPVRYFARSLGGRDLQALYLAADVMTVTPLKDGMNLVAQEFVATRHDERGVLVLSEFAGASAYLRSALLVNPWWVERLADTIATALRMSRAEQTTRMRALREEVRAIDLTGWARALVHDLVG